MKTAAWLQRHRTLGRLLNRLLPVRHWIAARVWSEAESDPAFVAAMATGLGDARAGRFVPFGEYSSLASEHLARSIELAYADYEQPWDVQMEHQVALERAYRAEVARHDEGRNADARRSKLEARQARIVEAYNEGIIDGDRRDRELRAIDEAIGS